MGDTSNTIPIIRPLDDGLHAEAGLLFVCGGEHPLFAQREGPQRVIYKFVSVADVARAFTWENADTGWLPPGLRRWGRTRQGNFAMLHIPAAKYCLHLHRPSREEVETVTVPLPNLVLIGCERSYQVFALRDDFAPQAPLYHAPLPNVYPSGEICFGVNTPPLLKEPCAIVAAWKLFIESPFNADLASGKSHSCPDDVRSLLRKLNGKRTFPLGELAPMGHSCQTAEEALQGIVSQHNDPLPQSVQRLVSPNPAERDAALAEQIDMMELRERG